MDDTKVSGGAENSVEVGGQKADGPQVAGRWFALRDARWVSITGELIVVPAHPNHKFLLHQRETWDGSLVWVVTEQSSGCACDDAGSTDKSTARQTALFKLNACRDLGPAIRKAKAALAVAKRRARRARTSAKSQAPEER